MKSFTLFLLLFVCGYSTMETRRTLDVYALDDQRIYQTTADIDRAVALLDELSHEHHQ